MQKSKETGETKGKEKLSIIIITLNEEKTIRNLLNDLHKQTFKDYEIIVSDSNSTDNTENEVRAFKKSKNMKNLCFKNCKKTLGPAYGRNYGVKFARYNKILFLDADTRIEDKDFLKKLMDYWTKKKLDAGSMYYKIRNKNIVLMASYAIIDALMFILQYFYPFACGAFMFSTKEVHKKIGGFKEDIAVYEDCDYALDAQKAGFKFRMAPLSCKFSERRIRKDGFLKIGLFYIKFILIRLITNKGIKRNKKVKYSFGKY